MKPSVLLTIVCMFAMIGNVNASEPWSVVTYLGLSRLSDQSPQVVANDIASGTANVSLDTGFTTGLSVRYNYGNSPWSADIGWEYRSNDSVITVTDDSVLPGGNYASNTFYLNGRYRLEKQGNVTPWLGGGISTIQEVDIDSEGPQGERSFEDSGAFGLQLMVGVDYDIDDLFYLSGELRYTSFTGLTVNEELGDGRISGLDYQPLTVGIGLGYRF